MARDVEHGIENVVGAALVPRQVTVTITTIPDYCLTSSSVAPGSPAVITTSPMNAVTANSPTISLGSSGAVSTLATAIPLSGTQTFGSSIMQSLASHFSATASVQASPSQPPATALPATLGPVIVSNATASTISAMTSRLSSTSVSSSVPSTSAQGTSAPAPSTSAKSDSKRVVTGGILTAALTVFILSGVQFLLF
ncbi:hypothetical protein MMC27_001852 [Xylographa pallens]|nr:hypothetical protein [Xylographa pallens]